MTYFSTYIVIKSIIDFQYVVILIIIITLFQEDNIFGTNASLTYGTQLQNTIYIIDAIIAFTHMSLQP